MVHLIANAGAVNHQHPRSARVFGGVQLTSGSSLWSLFDTTYRDQWRGTKAEVTSNINGRAWVDALGRDFDVRDLSPAVVANVVDAWVEEGLAPATINRKLAAISVMLTVAVKRGLIPARFVLDRKKEYAGRLRWYDDQEISDWFDFAGGDAEFKWLLEVALDTGARHGELMDLRVRDCLLTGPAPSVTFWVTKGDKPRTLPLTERAPSALVKVTEGALSTDRVFPERLTTSFLAKRAIAWRKRRGLADDDGACFHTWRHTCCSRMVQRAVPILVVQKWMGHSSINTTMRYAHLAPNSFDVALLALNKG